MTNFTYIQKGYGAWSVRANGLDPVNVSAIIDSLLTHYAVKDAFHTKRATLYIKFNDSQDLYGNRSAIERAFAVSTY